jgi:TolB-like protein/Tfp pilus assembly protein PilF
MATFLDELKRRNVVKVAVAYAVVAWLLIEVSSVLLPAFEAPEWVLRVVIFLIAIGFVLALVLSWAFELTPQGVLRTEDVPESESVTQVTGQKLNYLIIAALVLALAFVVVDNYVLDDAEPEAVATDAAPAAEEASDVLPNSVAVLLCDNLSPSPDDAYFAASIHEEILNQLVKISSLNVIARTSVLKYADSGLAIPEIAAELNVGAVMECSVRFAGSAIMVTAQLIDPATDSHLWSDTYPGDLSDLSAVFAMQADIATNIAAALQAELTTAEQERIGHQATMSAEAYTLYLKAIRYGVAVGMGERLRLFDEAIRVDPEFALAYAGKARSLAQGLRFGINRTAETEQLTIDLAERALAIEPALATAQLALAAVHELNWRREDAEQAYATALMLYPNDPVVALAYAIFKRSTGEYEEAVRLAQIAARLNPNTPNNWHQLGVTYLHANDTDAAFVALQNALALNPQGRASNVELGGLYPARGDLDAARSQFQEFRWRAGRTAAPVLIAWSAIGLERAGLQQEAEEVAAGFLEQYPTGFDTGISRATVYVAAHRYDEAFDELERAIASEVPVELGAAVEFKVNRWNHPVLNEPRFVALRDKLGYQD